VLDLWQRSGVLGPLLGTWLLFTAPAADPPPAADSAPAYDAATAAADAKLVLRARGQDYLDARARLEAHPEPAVTALMAVLEEPLGPAERQRALAILSGFQRPELIPVFSDLLRKSMLDGKGMDPWRALLLEQGAQAAPAFMKLTGDTELSPEDRAIMLEDLVTVIGSEALPDLVGMLGRGDRKLQAQLRRSLARRGRAHAGDAEVIERALDAIIDGGDDARPRAAAIAVRASMATADDAALESRLASAASDEDTAFIVRVAAIRALENVGATARDQALSDIARKHLSPQQRATQASEILGWLAIGSLPPQAATPVVDELDLVHADAPRLAALGYAFGTLRDAQWLTSATAHPWPEVRASALGRVEGPCDRPLAKQLATIAGPVSRGGEPEATVARAAIVALGRCHGAEANARLTDLVFDDGIGYEQRAQAARQLVEHGGVEGTQTVARALRSAATPGFAERLASALGRSSTPHPSARDALCLTMREVPRASATARRSFDRLFPDERCDPEG
jgi:hypothetical protein